MGKLGEQIAVRADPLRSAVGKETQFETIASGAQLTVLDLGLAAGTVNEYAVMGGVRAGFSKRQSLDVETTHTPAYV